MFPLWRPALCGKLHEGQGQERAEGQGQRSRRKKESKGEEKEDQREDVSTAGVHTMRATAQKEKENRKGGVPTYAVNSSDEGWDSSGESIPSLGCLVNVPGDPASRGAAVARGSPPKGSWEPARRDAAVARVGLTGAFRRGRHASTICSEGGCGCDEVTASSHPTVGIPDWSAGRTITGEAGKSVSKGPAKGDRESRQCCGP